MSEALGRFQAAHIQSGRNPLRIGDPDLVDNPALWRTLWACHRAALLRQWLFEKPGCRPGAWWFIDRVMEPPDDELDWLAAHGELGPDELAAIGRKAAALEDYNRGRGPAENYVPDRLGLVPFARSHGLL